MKTITSDFKNNVKLFGRQIDSIITYTLNDEEIELGNENLNSVSPHYTGSILKSVMKQLDIDSNIDIPVGTEINFQFGVKVSDEEVEDYRDNYEYINFGNYVVYSSEKQEDMRSYKIVCYDKMINSMKEYENSNITYPITIRDYLNTICNKLGINFASASDTFANYNKQIQSELYLSYNRDTQQYDVDMGYTFRDVLDEIAQATASTICINEDDELEVRYINDTQDMIDEEYLKDINVNFGEQYGPVNTIVLSRSVDSDKVYRSYPENLPDNEKISIQINDNQIMNGNDRADYLPDILNKLLGFQYYVNDFSSTGICYYDLCDRYTIKIDDNYYSCVMLNDEITITQGLKENVYTDLLETSVTDYKKADKTDRRINQTYLIVDKQNQEIQSVVSTVDNQNSKISTLTQKVDSLESEISNVTGMVITKDSTSGSITFTDSTNESEPITIKVFPTADSISYLYPNNNLFPSDNLYLKTRTIRFYNNTTEEIIYDYELPDDLLYYDSEHYDEFYLDLNSQTCQIIKRCKFNADGSIGLLDNETIVPCTYEHIELTEGIYTISLLGYNAGYILTTLMAKNIYTDQFYTKVETNSLINQTADNITLGVNQTLSNYSTTAQMNSAINVKANEINSVVSTKVGNNEVISKINQSSEQITINANKLNLQGYITATNLSTSGQTTINGANITTGTIKSSNYVSGTSGTSINLSNGVIDTKNFKVDSTGNITANNVTLNSGTFKGSINTTQDCKVGNNLYVGDQNDNGSKYIYFSSGNYIRRYFVGNMQFMTLIGTGAINTKVGNNGVYVNNTQVGISGDDGSSYTATFKHNRIDFSVNPVISSDKKLKKNIKKIKDVSWIDDLKIKEYEYKKASGTKRIGLIAQDYIDKDYAKYFLEKNENGYYGIRYNDITNALIQYSQELKQQLNKQQEEIEELKKEIKSLKESDK